MTAELVEIAKWGRARTTPPTQAPPPVTPEARTLAQGRADEWRKTLAHDKAAAVTRKRFNRVARVGGTAAGVLGLAGAGMAAPRLIAGHQARQQAARKAATLRKVKIAGGLGAAGLAAGYLNSKMNKSDEAMLVDSLVSIAKSRFVMDWDYFAKQGHLTEAGRQYYQEAADRATGHILNTPAGRAVMRSPGEAARASHPAGRAVFRQVPQGVSQATRTGLAQQGAADRATRHILALREGKDVNRLVSQSNAPARAAAEASARRTAAQGRAATWRDRFAQSRAEADTFRSVPQGVDPRTRARLAAEESRRKAAAPPPRQAAAPPPRQAAAVAAAPPPSAAPAPRSPAAISGPPAAAGKAGRKVSRRALAGGAAAATAAAAAGGAGIYGARRAGQRRAIQAARRARNIRLGIGGAGLLGAGVLANQFNKSYEEDVMESSLVEIRKGLGEKAMTKLVGPSLVAESKAQRAWAREHGLMKPKLKHRIADKLVGPSLAEESRRQRAWARQTDHGTR